MLSYLKSIPLAKLFYVQTKISAHFLSRNSVHVRLELPPQ